LRDGIVDAYASSLAPVFWYLIPFLVVAFALALFLKQVPLSDTAGMVARGEAIGGEEAIAFEEAQRAQQAAPGENAMESEGNVLVAERPSDKSTPPEAK
jgi:hypothetical protein